MNVTNAQYKSLEKAVGLLDMFYDNMADEERQIVEEAEKTLCDLRDKKVKDVERTKLYYRVKRKTNKAYGRGNNYSNGKINHYEVRTPHKIFMFESLTDAINFANNFNNQNHAEIKSVLKGLEE